MNLRESFERSIQDRVCDLPKSQRFETKSLGEIGFGQWQYPIIQVIAKYGEEDIAEDDDLPRQDILLSGLVHGDEPAGGLAILHFLKHYASGYLEHFNFYCYPCVNPSGFEIGRRENMYHDNLNRSFHNASEDQEVRLILDSLRRGPPEYAATIDLHKCNQNAIDLKEEYSPEDNPSEFWMWETATEESGLRIGDKVIADLKAAKVPVCAWDRIYGDKNNRGVIWYPDSNTDSTVLDQAGRSFDAYLYRNFTDHSFTIETPTHWMLERRIDTHILALCSILDNLKFI